MKSSNLILTFITTVIIIPFSNVWAQQGDGTRVTIESHVFKPDKVDPTPERLAQIKTLPGFKVNIFASHLKNARVLAVSDDGTIYVSRREQGDVFMLKDLNQDGYADETPIKVASRAGAHGLAIKDKKLYLATVKEIFVADILPDGKLSPLRMIIGDLPDAGQHPNRTLAFGPDGMLYITSGSTCNACNEANPENGTILRATPDGKSRTIFASGLRNTIGFDWHPTTGELWGMDNGIDFLGDEVQPEELNKIEANKNYGWPHSWGKDGVNPQSTPVGGISKEQWKKQSTPMVLGYTAHAAPMQFVFYKGGSSFPAQYTGDAFVTMRGSWNRAKASGYEIVRIQFANGVPKAIEPFVSGFLTDGGQTHIARPMGLAFAKDGALLMADDANGVIYRIAYTGRTTVKGNITMQHATTVSTPPANAMLNQTSKGNGVPLTKDRVETKVDAKLMVSSSGFRDGALIPAHYSEYADAVSPALTWTAVKGAQSYAIIVEDPDAKAVKPFVHWLAWNIPVTSLSEGLPKQERLTEPEGLLQGKNSRGSVGYFGMRPPVGDPKHHYYFQVLALDTVLQVPGGADRDQVLNAAKGHILAKGYLLGLFEQHQQPQK